MRENICFIYGAGEHYAEPPMPDAGDIVIAADGGYAYLMRYNIPINLIVGDFDSLGFIPDKEDTITLPQIKDDTDMAAALQAGWNSGFRIFHIYGGTGGRLDHTLANIQCLANLAECGGRGFLFDKETVITAIHNDTISFPVTAKGIVSVFAHSDTAAGVYESGLKYSLEDATLSNTSTLGISNEFIGEPGSIAVREGTLIIIYPKGIER